MEIAQPYLRRIIGLTRSERFFLMKSVHRFACRPAASSTIAAFPPAWLTPPSHTDHPSVWLTAGSSQTRWRPLL
jgi:hypothetical protein